MKKKILTICLVGFAIVFLAGQPTRAYACGTCEAATCAYYGDVYCAGGQYNYPANGSSCSQTLPTGCIGGSGGWNVQYIDMTAGCGVNGSQCICGFLPAQWEIKRPCN